MALIILKDLVKEPEAPKVPVKSFLEIIREAKGSTEPVANPRPEYTAEPVAVSSPAPVETRIEPTIEKVVEQAPQYDSHHVLIVNGQAKKVGKKSQYLLDMLTIET
jgi:hypothetical protein